VTAAMMLLLLSLPGEEQPGPQAGDAPSLELLEYIGGMEEDSSGKLLDPLDLPQPSSTATLPSQPLPQVKDSSEP